MRAVQKASQKIAPQTVALDFGVDDIEHLYEILCDLEETKFCLLRKRLSEQLRQSKAQTVMSLSLNLNESELEQLSTILHEYSDYDQLMNHIDGAYSLVKDSNC